MIESKKEVPYKYNRYRWLAREILEDYIYENLAEKIAQEIMDKIIESDEEDKLENETCLAVEIISKWARRGMIMGQVKEKYNTTRWYAYFGNLSLHTFFYPRHMYTRYKWKWMWTVDQIYIKALFRFIGLNYIFIKWQIFCYKSAYKEIEKKYPNVDNCIDYRELLK